MADAGGGGSGGDEGDQLRHVRSSIAGSSSGDFHVYRDQRRREQERIAAMEADAKRRRVEEEEAARLLDLRQRQAALEDRSRRRSTKSKERKRVLRSRREEKPKEELLHNEPMNYEDVNKDGPGQSVREPDSRKEPE